MDVLGFPQTTWVVPLTALIMLWSLCGLLAFYDRRLRAARSQTQLSDLTDRPHATAQIYQFPAAQTQHVHRKGGGIV